MQRHRGPHETHYWRVLQDGAHVWGSPDRWLAQAAAERRAGVPLAWRADEIGTTYQADRGGVTWRVELVPYTGTVRVAGPGHLGG